jgi:hypothetical protein
MSRTFRFLTLAPILVAALLPRAALGQTVTGRMLELWSNKTLPGALVMLVTEGGDSVSAVWSDDRGDFALAAPGPGVYYVSARKIGYGMVVDGPLVLEEGSTAVVGIHLQPAALYEMAPITVTAEPAVRHLVSAGFYERQRSGSGVFLGPDHVEKRISARNVSDLLQGLPGVTIDHSGNVRLRGMVGGQGTCGEPLVYIDGFPSIAGNEDLKAISPMNIAGIEVYRRPVEVPAEYGGATSGCGVIVLWTQRGR